jgi:hypothetical protein
VVKKRGALFCDRMLYVYHLMYIEFSLFFFFLFFFLVILCVSLFNKASHRRMEGGDSGFPNDEGFDPFKTSLPAASSKKKKTDKRRPRTKQREEQPQGGIFVPLAPLTDSLNSSFDSSSSPANSPIAPLQRLGTSLEHQSVVSDGTVTFADGRKLTFAEALLVKDVQFFTLSQFLPPSALSSKTVPARVYAAVFEVILLF